MKPLLFQSVLLSLVLLSAAQDVPITDTWNVTQRQLDEFRMALKNVTVDTKMYSWGKWDVGMRWQKQGVIDQGEIDWYIKQGSVYGGGGIYMASTITGSTEYGVWLTVFTIPKGTPIYDASLAYTVFGKSLSPFEKARLGRVVPFIDMYTYSYRVIHNSTLTRGLVAGVVAPYPDHSNYPTFTSEVGEVSTSSAIEKMRSIDGFPNVTAECDKAERLMHAADFFGMVYLHRAISANSSHYIWETAAPERQATFDRYVVIKRQLYHEINYNYGIYLGGVAYSGTWGQRPIADSQRDLWVTDMRDKTIPNLWHNLTGAENSTSMFRTEGHVHYAGRWIAVTPSVLASMADNKFLHLEQQVRRGCLQKKKSHITGQECKQQWYCVRSSALTRCISLRESG